MLKEVYAACKTKPEMTLADVMIECTGVGIKLATVEQAFRLGEFPRPRTRRCARASPSITLLLTMTDASFVGIVASLFDVFGGEACVLTGKEFMSLFTYRRVGKGASVDPPSRWRRWTRSFRRASMAFGAVNNCVRVPKHRRRDAVTGTASRRVRFV